MQNDATYRHNNTAFQSKANGGARMQDMKMQET